MRGYACTQSWRASSAFSMFPVTTFWKRAVMKYFSGSLVRSRSSYAFRVHSTSLVSSPISLNEMPLGAGGMGEVYRARDTRLKREVAIKVLRADLTSDADLRGRFMQEAQAVCALQHPNICFVHDIGSQNGMDFMVMELVSGQTLDKLLQAGPLATDVAVRYAIQIADALAHAHSAGITHRDLKPSNIIVENSGLVKVLDFGLAKLAGPPLEQSEAATVATMPGMIVGTAAYMSPEQAEGKATDSRSDVFSFGSVLYEMLTGKRAFDGNSSAALLAAIMRD